MRNTDYLLKLKHLHSLIKSEFESEIFYFLCKKYQSYSNGLATTKQCPKEDLITYLVDKGLMKMSYNKTSGEQKFPDDRPIRLAVRRLMRNGLPILSSSTQKGYWICDSADEISQPYKENKKRALSLLAMQKSYEKMSMFVSGQISIDDVDLEIDKGEDNEPE